MSKDLPIRRLAEQQHGVVATAQAHACGVDARALVRQGGGAQWERLTPRVIRVVGARRSTRQEVMAAVLDAGRGAVSSHETAAALWRLPGASFERLHVTRGGRRSSRELALATLHRPHALLPHHVTTVDGIPCTSVARTIFDLAGTGTGHLRIENVVNQVTKRSPGTLVTLHQLLAELAQRGRPGITTMRAVLDERPVGIRLPESGLEARFERVLKDAGQRPLERQVDLGGHEWLARVDYLDRELLLLAEVDSELHHTSPEDRARDQARDEALLAAGFRMVVRVSEEAIWHRPWEVVHQIAMARAELRRVAA